MKTANDVKTLFNFRVFGLYFKEKNKNVENTRSPTSSISLHSTFHMQLNSTLAWKSQQNSLIMCATMSLSHSPMWMPQLKVRDKFLSRYLSGCPNETKNCEEFQ